LLSGARRRWSSESDGEEQMVSETAFHIVPAVLDRHETARYLGLGLSIVAELTATRELPSLKVGRRRLYRRGDLDSWLANKVQGGAA
jgi:excisionase family DNA binding protein